MVVRNDDEFLAMHDAQAVPDLLSCTACRFAEDKRLLLAVTGPLLAVVSPRFRRQWLAALRGERAPIKVRSDVLLELYILPRANVM